MAQILHEESPLDAAIERSKIQPDSPNWMRNMLRPPRKLPVMALLKASMVVRVAAVPVVIGLACCGPSGTWARSGTKMVEAIPRAAPRNRTAGRGKTGWSAMGGFMGSASLGKKGGPDLEPGVVVAESRVVMEGVLPCRVGGKSPGALQGDDAIGGAKGEVRPDPLQALCQQGKILIAMRSAVCGTKWSARHSVRYSAMHRTQAMMRCPGMQIKRCGKTDQA